MSQNCRAAVLTGATSVSLDMVGMAGLDGHGPIKLLQEDEAGELMGQGEAG